MQSIVLNAEQAELLRARSSFEIRDRGSNVIGQFIIDESDDLRIIKQRLSHPEPTYTWAEVKAHLKALEDAPAQREPIMSLTFDDDQALILLACVEVELHGFTGSFLGRAINSDSEKD